MDQVLTHLQVQQYLHIPIRGDGSSGVASVTISSGAITAAEVTTAGTGYTFAYIRDADIIAATNAGGAGSGSNLNVIITKRWSWIKRCQRVRWFLCYDKQITCWC